jgi:excisionase family DNA binding protein
MQPATRAAAMQQGGWMMNSKTSETRKTITVEEAAVLLGIGRGTAYEAARRGELPTLRFGRRLLVPLAALDQLLGAESRPNADRDREPSINSQYG